MIDFNSDSLIKLSEASNDDGMKVVSRLLIDGEELVQTFKTVRDCVVFTNKRIIAVNSQGMTGKKKDFSSLPYSKIQVYSVETSGTFDLDSELELYFSAVGKVRFSIRGGYDVTKICKIISTYTL